MALLAMLSMLLPSPAVAAGPKDVSATPIGRALAADMVKAFALDGALLDAGDLRVWDVGGSLQVAPAWVSLIAATDIIQKDGSIRTTASFTVDVAKIPAARTAGAGFSTAGVAAAAAPYWRLHTIACFATVKKYDGSVVAASMKSCYKIQQLINDGSAIRNYFALDHYGTVTSHWPYGIYNGWLASTRPSGATAMTKVDYAPRGDTDSSCQSVTLSVVAQSVTLPATFTRCEHWDMTAYDAGGSNRNKWDCGCFIGFGKYGVDREVAYMETVSVGQGKVPSWTLTLGFQWNVL